MKTILFGAAIALLSSTAMAATVTDKSMDKPAATRLASKPFAAPKPDDALKAADPTKVIEASTKAGPETAAAETPSTTAMTGMGGPEEPEAALPAPVRAFSANDYPPCTSRADDNCIQLDERGVRESLAAWQASHGADQTGMGGPDEPLDGAMPASASPASYPACRPGPGDDNCIQLYEPGVREQLASWQASHSGEQLAMGGPEEPIDEAAAQPLPEDAVMPASEEMAALPAKGPDTPSAI